MVFEPTFEEIGHEADELPDLGGDGETPAATRVGSSQSDDGTPEAEVEGAAAVAGADVEEDDLAPYGEE